MSTEVSKPKSSKNYILAILLLLFFSVTISFVIGEILLRLIPIPGVGFSPIKYNELIGRGFYPNSNVSYRNDRNESIKNRVNRWGYLDFERDKSKAKGVFRIGFFGDSYTEAQQVERNDTFFHHIEQNLKEHNVQSLAFGHSGLGPLQSYLVCQKEMEFFDLDMVVYVFVENDIGDQIREIKKDPNMPYAISKNGSFEIDRSFVEKNKYRLKWHHQFLQFARARSILISTLINRVLMLKRYGIKIRVTEADRNMATKTKKTDIPDQNDLPSTWSDSWKQKATHLAGLVISKWKMEVEQKKRGFCIMYVPRESEWQKETKAQDSWKPWLENFCTQNEIVFIDPTPSFFVAQGKGKEIYYDHFTPDGHVAFAEQFIKWFKKRQLGIRN